MRFNPKTWKFFWGPDPIFDLYVGDVSKLPVGTMRFIRFPDGDMACPFLAVVTRNQVYSIGSEARELVYDLIQKYDLEIEDEVCLCTLGDSMPTLCRAFLLSRWGPLRDGGDQEPKRIPLSKGKCLSCNPRCFEDGDEVTVEEYAESRGLFDLTEEFYYRTIGRLEFPEVTKLVGMALYDFDSFYAVTSFTKPDDFIDHLANVADHLMTVLDEVEEGWKKKGL